MVVESEIHFFKTKERTELLRNNELMIYQKQRKKKGNARGRVQLEGANERYLKKNI